MRIERTPAGPVDVRPRLFVAPQGIVRWDITRPLGDDRDHEALGAVRCDDERQDDREYAPAVDRELAPCATLKAAALAVAARVAQLDVDGEATA